MKLAESGVQRPRYSPVVPTPLTSLPRWTRSGGLLGRSCLLGPRQPQTRFALRTCVPVLHPTDQSITDRARHQSPTRRTGHLPRSRRQTAATAGPETDTIPRLPSQPTSCRSAQDKRRAPSAQPCIGRGDGLDDPAADRRQPGATRRLHRFSMMRFSAGC